MNKGNVTVYYGEGRGKTTAAIGYAIRAASQGKSVFVIQFLKGRNDDEISFIRRLEPEIKFFQFEKSEKDFDDLPENVRNEECMNIKNGFNFAKKVLVTGECNVLVLDELLGILDNKVITNEEVEAMMKNKSEETEIIFTGRVMNESIMKYADEVYQIQPIKTK
ncbi:cob(I)yrinic acid a,c-diamide adenosyltransferase [Lachnospiraceae bacterium ZAX-1]